MEATNYAMQQFLANESEKLHWDTMENAYVAAQQNSNHYKDTYEDTVTNSEAEDTSTAHASPRADSPDMSKQRRKEQNRTAQRAFRERKERYVKELEEKIKSIQEMHAIDNDRLHKENEQLRAVIKQMESEMYTLKGAAMAFEVSISKLREKGIEPPGLISLENSGAGELSPPASDQYSMTSGSSGSPALSYSPSLSVNEHHLQQQRRRPSTCDGAMEESEDFAESEVERFKHTPDPITLTGAKMIPESEIWDWLNRHPRFDDIDIESVCQAVKGKTRCSGSGPVVPENVLENIVQGLLSNRMEF